MSAFGARGLDIAGSQCEKGMNITKNTCHKEVSVKLELCATFARELFRVWDSVYSSWTEIGDLYCGTYLGGQEPLGP